MDYEFEVVDSPKWSSKDELRARNAETGKAQLVAGYCWDWIQKNLPYGL